MNHCRHLPALLREYLFPSGCAICGRMLLDSEEAWYGLCRDCMPGFAIDQEARCALCGRPLISEQGRCLSCREREGTYHFDRVMTLFPYTGAYRTLLRAYKFGKHRALGNFFQEKLIQGLSLFPASLLRTSVWIPVPPRPGKIKQTGWDQIEYLARLLERTPQQERGLPIYRCLKRLPSQSQKELSGENRKTNLLGRIRCTKKVPPEVVLFDDVFTTGSTMDACAAALKERGAEQVYGVCLFYD
ncbi:MAG: double zinc ribbon domain-containing protein [Treponema sp.]|nr:double zinc ribbon domain-containing protein [Treponema sp.]